MKYSVAIFALFTVATAELTKVPRSEKVAVRQADALVQTAVMSNANGEVIPFDAANVYKPSGQ
ncbi:hypothetical protein GGR54DRAFT_641405 [Hypoxylon sp. NC1633]|nr:hypothetical protein GGR54DRAFT_641405 [Hypoxylon sp. NC1633]